MKIVDVTPSVKWIGILDYDIVTFDIVMETKYGTTYNSYFIDANEKAIIDTAKATFSEQYLEKVKKLVKPEELKYLIVNHTEPDHAGCVKHIIEYAPNVTILGSGNAIRYLNDITGIKFNCKIVKDGDTLSLGNKTLRFISAPNLHWPDSIYTYLEEDKLLFTCDSFGAHFCHEALFDDLTGPYDDAFKYYFDVILKPFSKFMLQAIEKIKPLDIEAICPGHGPILRKYWKEKVQLSEDYSKEYLKQIKGKDKKRILITYVSAYGYTNEIAKLIAQGLSKSGDFEIKIFDIEKMPLEELSEEIASSDAYLVGTPTINQNTLLQVYNFFSLINPIRDRDKLANAFGSYGWSGEAVKIAEATMKALKLKVEKEGLSIKFKPHEETISKCIEFGEDFGKRLISLKEE